MNTSRTANQHIPPTWRRGRGKGGAFKRNGFTFTVPSPLSAVRRVAPVVYCSVGAKSIKNAFSAPRRCMTSAYLWLTDYSWPYGHSRSNTGVKATRSKNILESRYFQKIYICRHKSFLVGLCAHACAKLCCFLDLRKDSQPCPGHPSTVPVLGADWGEKKVPQPKNVCDLLARTFYTGLR